MADPREDDHLVLCRAIEEGDKKTVENLLQAGVNVNNIQLNNSEILHTAIIKFDDSHIIAMLLDNGVDIHTRNHNGSTPLDIAIENNKTSAALLLLKRGALVGGNLNSVVEMAICKNNCTIMENLMEHMIKHNSPLNLLNDLCEKLWENEEVDDDDDDFESEVLLHACSCGSYKTVEALLRKSANPNFMNEQFQTSLHLACLRGGNSAVHIIRLLIQYGANIEAVDGFGLTPLLIACQKSTYETILFLLEKRANPNAIDKEGRSALHIVFKRDRVKLRLIRLLLEHGGYIDLADNRGWTPLFFACNNRNVTAMRYLLKNHANPNHTDVENLTPLHIAVKQVHEDLNYFFERHEPVKLLIKHGADINILDKINRTPLLHAVQKILLSYNDFSCSIDVRKSYEIIVKLLVSQAIKLKTAGLKIHNYKSDIYNPNIYITIDNRRYSAVDILQTNIVSDCNELTHEDIFSYTNDSVGDIRELQAKCEREIKRMKNESIRKTDLTFYDLLKGDNCRLREFFKNGKKQKTLKKKNYAIKFPSYIDIVENRIRIAKIHYDFYILSPVACEYFLLKITQRLPVECIIMVLKYLDTNSLKRFIEALKP